ncbi:hypothetical protein [Nesterenkonia sp. PF2B19]|uniref:hypothetical protein n=1 Tax=unclassified Nesterenkonia TaxID=2629769 RepID=UPI0008730BC8|nr:hypothetical protein [Nesterenkonia sp. PF2B19]
MTTKRGRVLRAAGASAVLTLAVTACGNDLPSGPMDENELETVFLTGRAVPEGWDLQGSPSSRDRFGETLDGFGPLDGQLGDPSEGCVEARSAGDEELAEAGMVAGATATYVTDQAMTEVEVFSTEDDVEFASLTHDMLEACESEIVEDLGRSTGLDGDDFEVSSPDTSGEGMLLVNDGADGGVVLLVIESYGNNHFTAVGFSADPRDVETLEGFIDEAQERFEQGPDETASEEESED